MSETGGPFEVVRNFEAALAEYTGAPHVVTTTSCTMALLLACAWHLRSDQEPSVATNLLGSLWFDGRPYIEIPRRTYVGVPMSILHAGGRPVFRDEEWVGEYCLKPLPIWDCARWLRAAMYRPGTMMCLSFHHTKHLPLAAHGGAILLDDPEAAAWLRRARFDGRTEGVPPREDRFTHLGWHCYMTPPTAAEGLMRLVTLPRHNEPLPWGRGTASDYPDLSTMEVFR